MDKEELIIDEKFREIGGGNVDQLYLNLYSDKVEDSTKKKLLYLFSAYHWSLNFSLLELNRRIANPNKYYTANDSRKLIHDISAVFELIDSLKNTKYEFRIDRTYYFYLKEALTYLKASGGTTIPENIKQISIVKYEKIFKFVKDDNKYVSFNHKTNDLLTKVSNRNTDFLNMDIDEKIGYLNMAIENILMVNKKYIQVDSNKLFLNLITNEDIINYRKVTHCFRHGSEEMIMKRNEFSEKQKIYLVNFGLTICDVLVELKQNS